MVDAYSKISYKRSSVKGTGHFNFNDRKSEKWFEIAGNLFMLIVQIR